MANPNFRAWSKLASQYSPDMPAPQNLASQARGKEIVQGKNIQAVDISVDGKPAPKMFNLSTLFIRRIQ
jgi:hypothetical protein